MICDDASKFDWNTKLPFNVFGSISTFDVSDGGEVGVAFLQKDRINQKDKRSNFKGT
jgi:hypothetical protein